MAECCTNIVSFQPFVERTVSKLNSHMEAFFFYSVSTLLTLKI